MNIMNIYLFFRNFNKILINCYYFLNQKHKNHNPKTLYKLNQGEKIPILPDLAKNQDKNPIPKF